MNMLEHNSVRAYPPVYKGTLEQAMGERDVDAYLDSRKLNLDCKKAIEEAIRENFDGLHLKQDAAKEVRGTLREERMNLLWQIPSVNFPMMEDFQTEQRLGGAYRSPGKCQPG